MNRREFLKFLIAAPIAAEFDVEKLLWIPGEKTIFLPGIQKLSTADIVAIELERILPKIKALFEQDDLFYSRLRK